MKRGRKKAVREEKQSELIKRSKKMRLDPRRARESPRVLFLLPRLIYRLKVSPIPDKVGCMQYFAAQKLTSFGLRIRSPF